MLDWMGGRGARAARHGAQHRAQGREASGLLAGTSLATETGWRPVEALRPGDLVLTFDHGAQPVRRVTRRLHPGPGQDAPRPLVRLPDGAVGNRGTMTLMPDQGVMVESDLAEAAWGDPFALIPAGALAGLPGAATLLPEEAVVVVTLAFEADEMVWAEGQALLHCPARAMVAPETLDEAVLHGGPRYAMRAPEEARLLAADLCGGATGTGLRLA